ncbi:MAG TPA: EAL domain-containing protein [Nitrospiraceae bacterium]|jgi:diguanylate cyclase (GGDEF)-like protein|nr:EAL domain-containing protein [Nitrospiraceae bacterium]
MSLLSRALALMPSAQSTQPVLPETGGETTQAVTTMRHNFLQLQTLVTIVLSYQLLLSPNALITPEVEMLSILGLLLLCGMLMVLPARLITADWFPGALAVLDTVITSALIYFSGNAGSDLYLAYFVIILIVTASRTTMQMTLFLTLVTTIYGFALYREIEDTGEVLERHLIRIPLLLVMAIFYRRTAESVRLLTYYDPVTGLPNRRQFVRLLGQQLTNGAPVDHRKALLFLDLDGFKLINDTLGHVVGDQLLKAVAARLKQCLRTTDTIARLGPDEFSVLLQNITSPDVAGRLAQRILDTLKPSFTLAGHEVFVTASIGIAISSPGNGDAGSLIKNADAAMYRAKERGKNSYEFYSPDMNAQAYERLVLESRLHKALERNEIVVYYQPLIHLSSRRMIGVEALARWKDPVSGLIPPAKFIPLAEETGLIVKIGESVLRQACRQLKAWHDAGHTALQLSVNLSARQFKQPDLAKIIAGVLAEIGLEPSHLDLELTETSIMQDAEAALKALKLLKGMGVRVSIDDFGTGYSSLIYLRRFPIDTLKIDRAFTQDMMTSPDAQAIIAAIIAMAQALKLTVIAEGIETDEQTLLLQKQGCLHGQGFAFSEPVSAEEMSELLKSWPGGVGRSPSEHRFPATPS